MYLNFISVSRWNEPFRGKGVFINTLVGGWAIENFCRQTFLTPLRKPPKLFEPPSTSVKTFLTPPTIATCIISVSFLNTNLFGMHHMCTSITGNTYAAVNGHLELPLLKDRQRFDAVSTSNLEVLKFRDWWILTYFIFGYGESLLNNF